MLTQCSRDLFGYEAIEGRQVVAAFDGGEVTSDAGGLLLGATDRAIGLMGRFAACFADGRARPQVEHTVEAMVAQRVFGIALGYEDDRPRSAAPRPGAGDPRRQAHCPAQDLRAARRQEHAEPARARAFGTEPLPQNRT
jgi:Transposase DDE domain group 1